MAINVKSFLHQASPLIFTTIYFGLAIFALAILGFVNPTHSAINSGFFEWCSAEERYIKFNEWPEEIKREFKISALPLWVSLTPIQQRPFFENKVKLTKKEPRQKFWPPLHSNEACFKYGSSCSYYNFYGFSNNPEFGLRTPRCDSKSPISSQGLCVELKHCFVRARENDTFLLKYRRYVP